MRPIDRSRLALIAIGVLIASSAAPAWARSEKLLAYPREQAWPAAVRFLVVDERVKVTDKDADAGYVMFDLRDDGKLFHGSLELVSLVRDGQPVIRFVLHIADRPSWQEIAMLNRLEAKLHVELGSPPPPPPTPPAKKPDDRAEPKPDDRDRPGEPKPDKPRTDDDAPKLSPTP